VRVAAVSFDFTGTLAEPASPAEIYAEVLGRHGIEVRSAVLGPAVAQLWQELSFTVPLGVDRFGTHPEGATGFWKELLEAVCRRLELPAPSPFAAAELYQRFSRPEAWVLYPDALPCLLELRQRGVRLAVTSNFDPRLPDLLASLSLAPHLETVIYSAGAGVEKPHPAIFEALLRELSLPAAAVLHVGDRRREDVEGAFGAGLQALLLDRSGDHGDLASLAELPERLRLEAPR
jgi:putative hydrolase of the HAD superfamily